MAQDSINDMLSAWKRVSDDFVATLGKAFDQAPPRRDSPSAAPDTPQAAGTPTAGEVRRLEEQVQRVAQRLDRLEETIGGLLAQLSATPDHGKHKHKKQRKSGK